MRVRSPENIKATKARPCIICAKPPPSDCDHIRTRGAGGGDELENLMPLCRFHHIQKGRIGIKTFAEKYQLPISWESGWPRLETK